MRFGWRQVVDADVRIYVQEVRAVHTVADAFSGARLSQARTVLAHSTDLGRAVLAGTKALDTAYGEAKKAKQQLDGKGVAKSRRAAKMRRRKRSAGDHNHAGPHAENPEPGDTPEVIRDRAYTWQAGEALRLAHENELAPVNPKVVIRAELKSPKRMSRPRARSPRRGTTLQTSWSG